MVFDPAEAVPHPVNVRLDIRARRRTGASSGRKREVASTRGMANSGERAVIRSVSVASPDIKKPVRAAPGGVGSARTGSGDDLREAAAGHCQEMLFG